MDGPALVALAAETNRVLRDLGDGIEWDHSYVTDDKILCVYRASSKATIQEHGKCGGFPIDAVAEIRRIINPSTATGAS